MKPFEGPISCVELGGPVQKRDKVIISYAVRLLSIDFGCRFSLHIARELLE
jgi:hypothetical protein